MIRDYIPDSDLDFLPISDPGSKRHRIPDPQHWYYLLRISKVAFFSKSGWFFFSSYLASTTRHKFLNSLKFYFRRKLVLRGFTRMKTQNRDLWLLQCLRSGVVRRQNRARTGQPGAFTVHTRPRQRSNSKSTRNPGSRLGIISRFYYTGPCLFFSHGVEFMVYSQ